jgi:hypothetical protein
MTKIGIANRLCYFRYRHLPFPPQQLLGFGDANAMLNILKGSLCGFSK